MKDFTVELTSHKKIHEVNNSMCHNYYYVQYGRIYNSEHKRFRKFKFVVWFDIFDICEYYDKDTVTKQELARYANEIGWSYCEAYQDLIKSYNDCQPFYDWCNQTINTYNRVC